MFSPNSSYIILLRENPLCQQLVGMKLLCESISCGWIHDASKLAMA